MNRIRSLDSLRGLAALVVVSYHFSLVVPNIYSYILSIAPLRPFVSGEIAVRLFFVLSGFVLYLSLENSEPFGWKIFPIKRVIRLWPPVVAACLASAVLYVVFKTAIIGPSEWVVKYSWTDYPTVSIILGHVFLLDTDQFHSLDNPIWSLVVELRLSLIFPLIAASVRRWPVSTLLTSILATWLARHALTFHHHIMIIDPLLTLSFLDLFVIGAVLARKRDFVTVLLQGVPGWLIVILIWGLICWRGRLDQISTYTGVTLLVAASFSYARIGRIYALKPIVWLGERSFSLYLVHVPILIAMIYITSGSWPIGTTLTVSFALCLACTELFWLAVERPTIDLGKYISRRLFRKLHRTTVSSA